MAVLAGVVASLVACASAATASPRPAGAANRCGAVRIVSTDQGKLLRMPALKLDVRRCREAKSITLRAFVRTHGGAPRKIAHAAERRLRGRSERIALPLSRRGRERIAGCDAVRITVRGRFVGQRRGRVRARSDLRLRGACATQRPNVLLIVTDDQRLEGTMAVMPSARHEFGDLGTTYPNAFVTTPLCCPSRASIYSGKYAHNHGIRGNDGRAFDAAESWPRYLHDAGYFTGLFGTYLVKVPALTVPYWDRAAGIPADDLNDGAFIAAQADAFLQEAEGDDGRPWAMVLATTDPHGPWTQRPQTFEPLPPYEPQPSFDEQDLSDKHPAVGAEAARFAPRGPAWPIAVRDGQRTELEQADEMVAGVFASLDRLDERRDTLAIFTSDNGYLWGEHGIYHKLWPYLESVRVPLLVSWPGHLQPATVDDSLVANIDLAPTIMQAAGVTPGYEVDGRSLFSAYDRPWLLLEGTVDDADHVPGWTALVDDRQQYIRWEDGFTERYSLPADPFEMRASNAPDPELDARLATASRCAGAACP